MIACKGPSHPNNLNSTETKIAFESSKAQKIHELISSYAEEGKFNGSVLVAEEGKVIYKSGFGYANHEWSIPNQPDTKHRLASITKQFTAMLIVQLAAENKLDLNAPISTYLPDYPKDKGDEITIHHLLTHTSGIPNYTSFRNFRKLERNFYQPKELIQLFADSTLLFTPGDRFDYSNSGYVVLGVIVEQVSGKRYEEVLKEKILAPLEMHNTGYDHNSTVLKNRASGYSKMGRRYRNSKYVDMSTPFAAGALYSTVEDLYLWDQSLYTEQLLPQNYLDLIFQKHIPTDRQFYDYGYGWEIGLIDIGSTHKQVQSILHSGGINGFNTLITRMPENKSSVILLSNTGGAPLYRITVAINGILHEEPYDFPKKSVANALLKAIDNDGINLALIHYETIKNSAEYDLKENEMNLAGYELLEAGRASEAATVFQLNIDAFPNSFNVYDSYGEALLALGNREEAIENYKKSIRLNPVNENGLKVLRNLGVETDSLIIKVPEEQLKILTGTYHFNGTPTDWIIEFTLENGVLMGNDRGYRYRLVPVSNNSFINPDDGASLVFDTEDPDSISLLLFDKYRFRKEG